MKVKNLHEYLQKCIKNGTTSIPISDLNALKKLQDEGAITPLPGAKTKSGMIVIRKGSCRDAYDKIQKFIKNGMHKTN
jgi:hypothetical protein